MKIVWVSHSESLAAGAELCLWEGVNGLVAKGCELNVVVPGAGRLSERLTEIGVPVTVIPYRWWLHAYFRLPVRRLCRNLAATNRLTAIFHQIRPDVVISNTLAVPVGAFAARRAGIAHVWYIHEFGLEDHGLKFDFGSTLSLRLIARLSERVLVNSRAVFDKFRHVISEPKLRLIYYAVEIRALPESIETERNPFNLCLVGRVCAGKGQADAVRALGLLAGKGMDVRLSLVGNENREYGDFLRRLAKEQGVEERIRYVAFTEDPHFHVARAHAALVCSRSEAFGRVTVEAMKLGKPVVGADRAATSELIQDGITGFLYRPGDAGDLAGKLEILYCNRPLVKVMGESAREWSSRTFNLENHTSALLEVLHDAISVHRRNNSAGY